MKCVISKRMCLLLFNAAVGRADETDQTSQLSVEEARHHLPAGIDQPGPLEESPAIAQRRPLWSLYQCSKAVVSPLSSC